MQKVSVNNISSKNIQLLFIVLVEDEKRLRLEIGGGFPYFGWPLFLLNVEIDGTREFLSPADPLVPSGHLLSHFLPL